MSSFTSLPKSPQKIRKSSRKEGRKDNAESLLSPQDNRKPSMCIHTRWHESEFQEIPFCSFSWFLPLQKRNHYISLFFPPWSQSQKSQFRVMIAGTKLEPRNFTPVLCMKSAGYPWASPSLSAGNKQTTSENLSKEFTGTCQDWLSGTKTNKISKSMVYSRLTHSELVWYAGWVMLGDSEDVYKSIHLTNTSQWRKINANVRLEGKSWPQHPLSTHWPTLVGCSPESHSRRLGSSQQVPAAVRMQRFNFSCLVFFLSSGVLSMTG